MSGAGRSAAEPERQGDRNQIHALAKGLSVLAFLNRNDGVTALTIAKALRLSRPTVHRILLTLEHQGFVEQCTGDRLYRVTIQVRALSDGFTDRTWIETIAIPTLQDLGRELTWPVALTTLAGASVVVRYSSDAESPLVFQRIPAGTRVSMLGTAAGRLFLAYSTPAVRDEVLRQIRAEPLDSYDRLATSRSAVLKMLGDVRAQGHAVFAKPEYSIRFLAVPILSGEEMLAAVTLRVYIRAMDEEEIVRRYAGRLKEVASGIAERRALELRPQDPD